MCPCSSLGGVYNKRYAPRSHFLRARAGHTILPAPPPHTFRTLFRPHQPPQLAQHRPSPAYSARTTCVLFSGSSLSSGRGAPRALGAHFFSLRPVTRHTSRMRDTRPALSTRPSAFLTPPTTTKSLHRPLSASFLMDIPVPALPRWKSETGSAEMEINPKSTRPSARPPFRPPMRAAPAISPRLAPEQTPRRQREPHQRILSRVPHQRILQRILQRSTPANAYYQNHTLHII